MSAAHRAGRSLIWALIESGGLSLLSLGTLLVVARLVGPADLGAAALALGVVQMLTIIVDVLLHDAIVQRQEIADDHLQSAFWSCLGLGISFAILCWLSAPLIGSLFDSPRVAPFLIVAGSSLAFSGAASVPTALLRRDMNFKALAIRSLYGRLFGAAVAIGLAVTGHGIWSLVGQNVAQIAANTALVWPACSWRPAFRFSLGRVGELLRFGLASVGSRIVWLSSIRFFTMLVGHFLGVTAVGYLNVAQRVVDTLYDLLAGAAYNLALPIFSRRQEDRSALGYAYQSATEFGALTAPPVFAGLAVCAPAVVVLLLGPGWLPAAEVVRILAIAAMIQFLLVFAYAAITAVGRPDLIFGLSFVSLIFVVITFLAIHPASATEAATIWAARVAISGPILVLLGNRAFGLSATKLLRSVSGPLVATAVMVVALLSVEGTLLAGTSPLNLLLVTVPLGVTLYLIAISLASRDIARRLIVFVMAGLRRPKAS